MYFNSPCLSLSNAHQETNIIGEGMHPNTPFAQYVYEALAATQVHIVMTATHSTVLKHSNK